MCGWPRIETARGSMDVVGSMHCTATVPLRLPSSDPAAFVYTTSSSLRCDRCRRGQGNVGSARRPKTGRERRRAPTSRGYGGIEQMAPMRKSFEKPAGWVGPRPSRLIDSIVKRWAREKLGSTPVQTDKPPEQGGNRIPVTIPRALAGPGGPSTTGRE